MLGITGWKTIVGVFFGAFAVSLPQLKEIISPEVYKVLMIISSFTGSVLTGLGIAHKIEKGADKIAIAEKNQTGQIKFILLPIMMALILTSFSLVQGCTPNQSATQQIRQQTDDPAMIGLASYADALKAYTDAQEIYKPYRVLLEKDNPELSNQIKGYFSGAWAILKKWKLFGTIPQGDKDAFRLMLRNISISIAQQIDKK
jgi:hypothetical protein